MPTFVSDEVVTATKLNNGTTRDWTTWTPTLTNLNVGTTGTVVARYAQLGSETVYFHFVFTLGGTGISVGNVSFTLPVTAGSSGYVSQTVLGGVSLVDTSASTTWSGASRSASTTTAQVIYFSAAGAQTALSSTLPFTWATTDVITGSGFYEVA